MKLQRTYKGRLSDETFVEKPTYAIINDYPDEEDISKNGLLNSSIYKRFWYMVKQTDINTNNMAKVSVMLNLGYDMHIENSKDWMHGKESIFEILDDLYKKGTKSFLLLGERVHKILFEDNITFSKIRGSYLQHERYPDAFFISTYHPREMNIKRYKTGDGQAQLFLAMAYDIDKWFKAGLDSFHFPIENFNIYPTIDDVETFIYENMKKDNLFAMDLETTSLNRYWGKIVMVGLAIDEENALCIPFLKEGGKPYWTPKHFYRVKRALNHIFQKGKHMWQNSLFDIPYLMEKGFDINLKTIQHDTMLLHHAISPELPHDIGFITSLYGKTGYWKDDFLSSKKKILERNQGDVRLYNCRDCTVLHQILPGLLFDMQDNKQEPAYAENMANIPGAIEQMHTGVVLDTHEQKRLKKDLDFKIKQTEKKVRLLGKLSDTFNLNSADHLAYFLFGEPVPLFEHIDKMEKDFKEYRLYLYICENKKHRQWVMHEDDIKPCPTCGCMDIKRDPKHAYKDVSKRKKFNKDNEPTNAYQKLLDLKDLRDNTKPILTAKFFGKKNRDTNKVITDKQAREAIHAKVIERLSDLDSLKRETDMHKQERKALRKLSLWLRFYNLYRLYQKQLSTYTKYKPDKDNRIHTNIKLHGTASGRPSSSNPNLLNIPKKYTSTRYQFTCPEHRKIVSFDYSNIEAKMLAYITNDERFIEAVNSGNLHDINTKTLFKIDEDHPMWSLARRAAKIFQFGYISYGGQDKTIWEQVCIEAPNLNLSLKDFKKAGERYFDFYTDFAKWRDEVADMAIKHRYSISPFGRIRYLYGGKHDRIKQAYNHPPQSGAAHVMNKAMIETIEARNRLKLPANLQIQIYDDLRWEVDIAAIPELIKTVVPIMEQIFIINGKERYFETDIEIGTNWGNLKPVDKDAYL